MGRAFVLYIVDQILIPDILYDPLSRQPPGMNQKPLKKKRKAKNAVILLNTLAVVWDGRNNLITDTTFCRTPYNTIFFLDYCLQRAKTGAGTTKAGIKAPHEGAY